MPKQYRFVIDLRRCVGCRTCTIACKMENNVPLGISRCKVYNTEGELTFDRPAGEYPNLHEGWTPVHCMHCDDPACVEVCPSGAMYQREDGLVLHDADKCIGCRYCTWACPYQATSYNPETGVVEKCSLCAHRIDDGLQPMCVECCPARALHFGDLNDPNSDVARLINRRDSFVLLPQHGTHPKTIYLRA